MAGKIVHATVYEAFGERKSLAQWGSDPRCPVSRPGLYRRVNVIGLSVAEAFAHAPNTLRKKSLSKPRVLTAWGETKTLEEWAADPRTCASGPQMLSRIHRGFTPESAISKPMHAGHVKYIHRAFGESKALGTWANDTRCPVSRQGLYHRVNVLGMSIEQAFARGAFEDVKRTTGRTYRVKARVVFLTAWGETKTLQEWAADPRARASFQLMLGRSRRGGYTPEQTISLGARASRRRAPEKPTRGPKPLRTVTAWGETKSLLKWVADPRAGVGYRALLSRYLRGGYTPEEAISLGRNEDKSNSVRAKQDTRSEGP